MMNQYFLYDREHIKDLDIVYNDFLGYDIADILSQIYGHDI